MTYYDDHEYCEKCRLHVPSCWCFANRSAIEQVQDGEWDAEYICHGGPEHGYLGKGTPPWPPFATGGIVHGPGTAADDQVPFPITRCLFEDVARVFVVPEDGPR